MAKSPDRREVLETLAASRDARAGAKQQFTYTKEYLQPQAFKNRWKIRQNVLLKQVTDQSHEMVRKNAPVIAIMAVSALLFVGRFIIKGNNTQPKRDAAPPD